MTTAPERPQPLHNFFLPQLKWGHNSAANHRFRRRDRDSPRSRDVPHPSDGGGKRNRHGGGSDSESRPEPELPLTRSRPGLSPSNKQRPLKPEEGKGAEAQGTAEQNGVAVIPEEGETRTWNLRPRKGSITASFRNGEMQETETENNRFPKSQRLQQGHNCPAKKRKLWISLSKEEIEEDVYSLTGSRPTRRPKKRPRNVQKIINNLLPGLYLEGISVDSYRAYDSQM